jgi:predicted anti-sigma-YlaC factor YlaD
MTDCARFRELLAAAGDDDAATSVAVGLEAHLAQCSDCRALSEALALVAEAGSSVADLEPPASLAAAVCGPCRPWRTLLFRALDHDLDDATLDRLLDHLEGCEACASLWADLTLVRQASECLVPPPHLLHRCVWGVKGRRPMPVLGRRAAIAVAYALTVVATLVVGNPVTLARNPAAETLRNLVGTFRHELTAASADGRGELRVALWRAWTWTSSTADAARELIAAITSDSRSSDQGDTT